MTKTNFEVWMEENHPDVLENYYKKWIEWSIENNMERSRAIIMGILGLFALGAVFIPYGLFISGALVAIVMMLALVQIKLIRVQKELQESDD